MPADPTVTVVADPDEVAAHAAELIAAAATAAVRDRGRFTLVLAGGSTPEKAYRLLAGLAFAGRLPWDKTFAFVGDERLVPFDHPHSNFGMAKRSLLDHVPIPAANQHPIPTHPGDAAACAADYATLLADFFGQPPDGPPPRFDLILLGLGDDRHTASLFPGKPALQAGGWVTHSPPGELPPPVDRVTLTLPALNAARAVLFLVTGAKKAAPLRDVLNGQHAVADAPAAGVRPTDGTRTVVADAAAAALL